MDFRYAVSYLSEEFSEVADVDLGTQSFVMPSVLLEGVVGNEHQPAGLRTIGVHLKKGHQNLFQVIPVISRQQPIMKEDN